MDAMHLYERLPLFGTGIVLGLWLIALHAFLLAKPEASQNFLKRFPRNQLAKAAKGITADEAPDSPFARCPPASAQTVWLGSSDGRFLDRMTIAIAPYEVGPFAEGSYRINVPVTGALAKAVKDEFARDVLPIN